MALGKSVTLGNPYGLHSATAELPAFSSPGREKGGGTHTVCLDTHAPVLWFGNLRLAVSMLSLHSVLSAVLLPSFYSLPWSICIPMCDMYTLADKFWEDKGAVFFLIRALNTEFCPWKPVGRYLPDNNNLLKSSAFQSFKFLFSWLNLYSCHSDDDISLKVGVLMNLNLIIFFLMFNQRNIGLCFLE